MAKKSAAKATKRKTTKKKAAPSAAPRKATAKQAAAVRKPGANHSLAKGRARRSTPAANTGSGSDRTTKATAAKSRPVVRVTKPAKAAVERETPLTPQEIEQFRLMLLQKRAEILGDVSTLRNEALNKDRRDAAGDLSSMPIHMADLGTDNFELEFTLGLIEGERTILKEIDEALERIRNNTYGICLATGKPIGKARLKAKPWAKYCYEYTLAQEQGQTRRF